MVKKTKDQVVEILSHFQMILKNKPSPKAMFEEVRMMNFKIRPVQGDISLANFENSHFIEMLWSLGKLDELFQNEFRKLSIRNKERLYRIFDNLYQQFQERLNKVNLRQERPADSSAVLEMEIFKELTPKKKLN